MLFVVAIILNADAFIAVRMAAFQIVLPF